MDVFVLSLLVVLDVLFLFLPFDALSHSHLLDQCCFSIVVVIEMRFLTPAVPIGLLDLLASSTCAGLQ